MLTFLTKPFFSNCAPDTHLKTPPKLNGRQFYEMCLSVTCDGDPFNNPLLAQTNFGIGVDGTALLDLSSL
jgi:hypothetical protein